MKLLVRLLRLLVGLIYRLIVLALFERWIPFPERSEAERPARSAKPRAAPRERAPRRRAPESEPRAQPHRRGARPPAPIFEPRTLVAVPARVAALESVHLVAPSSGDRSRGTAPEGGRPARPLRALLRDKRALASAIVLGEAFARRPRPR